MTGARSDKLSKCQPCSISNASRKRGVLKTLKPLRVRAYARPRCVSCAIWTNVTTRGGPVARITVYPINRNPERPKAEDPGDQENQNRLRPLVVAAREAARLLAISERTLWSLTQRGEIRAIRIGKSV